MKDHKLLLTMIILLILIIFIGIFAWLWINNRKNMNPLPITSNKNSEETVDSQEDTDKVATDVLYLQAENSLKTPLDDVIGRFEARHSNVQVIAHYVPTHLLLALPDTNLPNNQSTNYTINIDIIIANDRLPKERLSLLQTSLNDTQNEFNNNSNTIRSMAQDHVAADNMISDNKANEIPIQNNYKKTRKLVSFSYALKGTQAVDGVILTDSPTAISFRNFLLSSTGQDILKQHDYENIEGYRNNLDDLFNPTSRSKPTKNESSIEIADALSNGK